MLVYGSRGQASSQNQLPNPDGPDGELTYAENVNMLFPQDPT